MAKLARSEFAASASPRHGEKEAAAEKRPVAEPAPSLVADQFMRIAQQVFLSRMQPVQTIVFCGASAGVGCTWACLKIAEALARMTTDPICLVDANLRAPSLHTSFGVGRAPGFSDFLTQTGNARFFATAPNVKNLWLLPAGNRVPNPESLFVTGNFLARVAQLTEEFRFVLIDSGTGPDPANFATTANGAILVVDAKTTRRDEAQRVKRNLQAVHLPLLGVVVNRTDWKAPR